MMPSVNSKLPNLFELASDNANPIKRTRSGKTKSGGRVSTKNSEDSRCIIISIYLL